MSPRLKLSIHRYPGQFVVWGEERTPTYGLVMCHLLRLIQRRFGAEVAGQCAPLLEPIAEQHLLEEIGEMLLDQSSVELLRFLRDKSGAP